MELSKGEVKKRGEANHPYQFSEVQLNDLLSPVRMNKKLLLSKKVVEQDVFNRPALDFLVPHLAQAFRDAKPNEEIDFAYLTHYKSILVKDDRITIIHAWVEGDTLHLNFSKLMAKLPNTYDQRGDVHKAIGKAQGVRVSLELEPGQQFGRSTEELLVKISSQKQSVVEEKPKETQKQETVEKIKAPAKVEPAPVVEAAPLILEGVTLEAKLKQLKDLKNQGLITNKEYKEKRANLLKGL